MKATVLNILKKINSLGYDAFLVGGCVRDHLLNIKPHDYDIATNMPMDIIKEQFHTIPVGEQYGILIIIENGHQFEIAQFRGEVYHNNSRKPVVTFGKTLEEDVLRRDFTINAMAMDKSLKIISNKQQEHDIKKGIIRFVGDPATRILEDPLRILRGIRFSVRYNFSIENKTLKAMIKHVDSLKNIPLERIQDELNKGILLHEVYEYFILLHKIGALKIILPEVDNMFGYEQKNSHHEYTLEKHTLIGVSRSPLDLKVRWAVLLHDIGKPSTAAYVDGHLTFHDHQVIGSQMAYEIMTRLKFSSDFRQFVVEAVLRHMGTFDSYKKSALKRLYDVFGKDLPLFIQVKIGDYYGHPYNNKAIIKINKMLDLSNRVYEMLYEIIENKDAFKKSDLAINGNTLIELGYKPGKVFTVIIDDTFEKVLDSELKNNRDDLIKYITMNYKNSE
jgi:tRNA nucleotidyltransferase (CCA-adding enzyme)